MCGIVGAVGLQGQELAQDTVLSMTKLVRHRGPDGLGILQPRKDLIFGHTRLAILDLSKAAAQPMNRGSGSITYNGEIYNFKQLSKRLDSDLLLESTSDTEVLLNLLNKFGISILSELDGFFAFAFFDGSSIFLVRDRFGQKPLYYVVSENILYFASEIKAFRALSRNFSAREGLKDVISSYRFSLSMSPFSGIEMLLPGHYLKIDLQSQILDLKKYYSVFDCISSEKISEFQGMSEGQVIDLCEELLIKSVRKRLLSDVPIGVVCSGGLDSSLLAALAEKELKLPLFHVDVVGNSETKYAKIVADYLNTELVTIVLDQETFCEHEQQMIESYEYPLVHPNGAGILAVAKKAREQTVPVLLGGEAADELFGGYLHHQRFYWLEVVKNYLGRRIYQLISQDRYPAARWKQYAQRQSGQFEQILENRVIELSKLFKSSSHQLYQAFLANEFETYLQPLLLRGDKCSMAYGVELRLPFLDKDLVEFSINLPAKFKFNKYILRKVAERYLPKEIIKRPKLGFPIPSTFLRRQKNGFNSIEQKFILDSLVKLEDSFFSQASKNEA